MPSKTLQKTSTLVICAILILLFNCSVYAYNDKNTLREDGCFDDGQVIIIFGNNSGKPYNASELKVTAQQTLNDKLVDKVFGLEGWYYTHDNYGTYYYRDRWFPIKGFFPTEQKVNSKYTMFASKEGYFEDKGTYQINVTDKENNVLDSSSVSCPGLVFSCSLVNVSLKKCFKKTNTFLIYFFARGIGKQSSLEDAKYVNLSEDFWYRLEGKKTSLHGKSLPNSTLTYLGNLEYLMEINNSDNFTSFEIETLGCEMNHPFLYESTRDKIRCGGPPECIENSECDDGNDCTIDRCSDFTCSHIPIEHCEEEPSTEPELPEKVRSTESQKEDPKSKQPDVTGAAVAKEPLNPIAVFFAWLTGLFTP